jgi:hypothetical protein
MLRSDLERPSLDFWALHFYRGATPPAHQMVVVLLGGASAIDRLAFVVSKDVDLARFRQSRQSPVDRGQAERRSTRPHLGVDVLSAAELIAAGQRL